MNTNIQVGKEGEALATQYLVNKGFIILYQNWRFSKFEIDIIARNNNRIHFVEVKTRTSKKYGNPEVAVSKSKFKKIQQAAEVFLLHFAEQNIQVQFDTIAITWQNKQQYDLSYFEDIYFI